MLSSYQRRFVGVLSSAVLFVATALPLAASPQYSPLKPLFCGGALNTARLVHRVAGMDPTVESLKRLQNTQVQLERGSAGLQVSVGAQKVPVPETAPSSPTCLTKPQGAVILDTASSIPGDYLAVLGSVFQYRKQHPWPTQYPAQINFDDTNVNLSERGAYDLVGIADSPRRYVNPSSGYGYIEGCIFEEYYRVNPATLEVLPYNGCIVGGQALVGILPGLLQLPQ